MSTASAIHLSLILFYLCYLLTCSPSWAMVEVPCSHPSPSQLRVSITSLCRLSLDHVHGCKNSLFARDPSLAFVGKRSNGRTLRSTIQSMSTVFGVCPWTRNLILHHSLRCPYLIHVHWECVESMSTSKMSLYLTGLCKAGHKVERNYCGGGVMQGRILDGNSMSRRMII